TDFSAKIARDTQLYLQKHTDLCKYIDPFGGSYYLEYLTNELIVKAEKLINEIEAHGGMAKSIEAGIPQSRIDQAAARKQARIDSGQDIIVGVNKYGVEEEGKLDLLEVDNSQVREKQIERL